MLSDARMEGSFFTGIPNGFVRNGSVLIALTNAAGKKKIRGFFQRQYSRSVSNSAGLSGRSRLSPPLPRSTRIIMRRLSISRTLSIDTSVRRMPVP